MTSGSKREESVQFSLKELLELEDQRLEEQQRAAAAEEANRARARTDAARREADARAAEEQTRRRSEELARQAELDELARREAMQKAIVEQARLEVEVRARSAERERERLHEVELARMRSTQPKETTLGGTLIGAAVGGGVMLAVLLGIHFAVTEPANARRIADAEHARSIAEAKADERERQSDAQRSAMLRLEERLASAERELLASRSRPATAPPPVSHVTPPHVAAPPAAPKHDPASGTCANKWDPLCGAIPR